MWKMQVTLGGADGCGRWNGGCGLPVWALVGVVVVTNGRCKGVMGGERVWSPVCMETYMDGCGSLGVIGEVNWLWVGEIGG